GHFQSAERLCKARVDMHVRRDGFTPLGRLIHRGTLWSIPGIKWFLDHCGDEAFVVFEQGSERLSAIQAACTIREFGDGGGRAAGHILTEILMKFSSDDQ